MKKAPDNRIQKEILRRSRQLNAPRSRAYLPFLLIIISIVYITDEIASQIGTLMKTEIANDMLAHFGNSSVGVLDILSMISVPFMALGIFYKPLADRFGRKPFLVINTLGMSLGLMIIYISGSIPMYVIGVCIIQFFVPHDMQAVYIMEAAPDKHRAKIYSVIKCAAMLGVMLIPALRRIFMHETSQWRRVYIIPAVVGLVVGFAALFFAKETDSFNKARIANLKGEGSDGQGQNGGLINALKFVWKHKQLRWLYLALACSETGFILTIDYQVIMTYGYAQGFVANGRFTDLAMAVESVGVNEITSALFMFPVGCALGQLIPGFIADIKSRKAAALSVSLAAVALFLGFSLGAKAGFNPYIVGFLAGACIGTFWANVDIINLMTGESAPTALRSSILAAANLATGLGIGLSYGISLPLITVFGNTSVAVVALCVTIPGLIAAFAILVSKTHDTNGIDLSAVTGEEWEQTAKNASVKAEEAEIALK